MVELTPAKGPWHKRGMSEMKTNMHPYNLEVTPNPRSQGAWQ